MNRSHDYVLWCAVIVIAAVSAFEYRRSGCRVHDGDDEGERSGLLSNRINPNSASWSSLARLPGIGPVRANAIVAYRDGYGGGKAAFGGSGDLAKVKGIGPRTVEEMAQYLTFAKH